MGKELEQDLGLLAVFAISIGAMVGSGIFILPGLALEMADSAVILAYGLAGFLVLPAALSKSEMATAMPESGGSYIYIERGMGPVLGTIAGVGTWFSLAFKSALALVGGAPYLVLLFDLPVKPLALIFACILIGINLVGVKQTGRTQIIIVSIMLLALVGFILGSIQNIDLVRYDGMFTQDITNILTATGFVFISYAGVTKVASVAEEIENPDRNIPLGILGSLFFTTILYIGIVTVMIGVAPTVELAGSDVPIAIAAENILATIGVIAVIIAAILALISTANAGILSSSRYPFAMSRDNLAPESFKKLNKRFNVPSRSITLTGFIMLFLIAFVDIRNIAKLASAFQIIVFILINLALIAFRESNVEEYNPSFKAPLYPFTPIIGVLGGIVLLTQIGIVPLVGSIFIIAGSLIWYFIYVYWYREVDREGVAIGTARKNISQRAVEDAESKVTEEGYKVLVAVTENTETKIEEVLLDFSTSLVSENKGSLNIVRFDEVPDQAPLQNAASYIEKGDLEFEKRVKKHLSNLDEPIEYGEIVSHDTKRAIVNYAKQSKFDVIVLDKEMENLHRSIISNDVEWIKKHSRCDVFGIDNSRSKNKKSIKEIEKFTVLTDQGPYDPTKVMVANSLASNSGASVEFLYLSNQSEEKHKTIGTYLDELKSLCNVSVTTHIIDNKKDIKDDIENTELLIVSDKYRTQNIINRPIDNIIESVNCNIIYAHCTDKPNISKRLIEKILF